MIQGVIGDKRYVVVDTAGTAWGNEWWLDDGVPWFWIRTRWPELAGDYAMQCTSLDHSRVEASSGTVVTNDSFRCASTALHVEVGVYLRKHG